MGQCPGWHEVAEGCPEQAPKWELAPVEAATFPREAGGGVALWKRQEGPPKVVQGEGHIPVSAMPGMWLPRQRREEETSWGLQLGEGPTGQGQEVPAGPGEKLRKRSL